MRISVVIPCYNAAAFLPRAVTSVRAQGVVGTEIIVVDDGSADDTRKVAQSLGGGVRVIPRAINEGIGRARNIGLREAHGQYVCFLDADDAYSEGLFTKALATLDAMPSVTAVWFPIRLINCHREVEPEHLEWMGDCLASNVIVRTEFTRRLGGFPTGPQFRTKHAGEDVAFRKALGRWGLIRNIDGVFMEYTVRRGSHFDLAIDLFTGKVAPDEELDAVLAAIEEREDWVRQRMQSAASRGGFRHSA